MMIDQSAMHELVTGDLSPFVSVSDLTSLLKTDDVSAQARRTAAIATCFSVVYRRAIIVPVAWRRMDMDDAIVIMSLRT